MNISNLIKTHFRNFKRGDDNHFDNMLSYFRYTLRGVRYI